jgi:hypothetical protein
MNVYASRWILLLCCFSLICSCTGDNNIDQSASVEKAVEGFYSTLIQGDIGALLDSTGGRLKREIKSMAQAASTGYHPLGLQRFDFEILDMEIDENEAEVTLNILGDNLEWEEELMLQLQNGNWLAVNLKVPEELQYVF